MYFYTAHMIQTWRMGLQWSITDTWGESPFWRQETDNWFGCDQCQGSGSVETPQKTHTIIWTRNHLFICLSFCQNGSIFTGRLWGTGVPGLVQVGRGQWSEEAAGNGRPSWSLRKSSVVFALAVMAFYSVKEKGYGMNVSIFILPLEIERRRGRNQTQHNETWLAGEISTPQSYWRGWFD